MTTCCSTQPSSRQLHIRPRWKTRNCPGRLLPESESLLVREDRRCNQARASRRVPFQRRSFPPDLQKIRDYIDAADRAGDTIVARLTDDAASAPAGGNACSPRWTISQQAHPCGVSRTLRACDSHSGPPALCKLLRARALGRGACDIFVNGFETRKPMEGEHLMRTRVFAALLAAAVAGTAGACSDAPAPTQPAAITVPVQFETGRHARDAHNHRTHLTGDAERPVPNDSKAQGQAIFQVSDDGSEIGFKLMVANIENVTQAHIHCCADTEGTAASSCGSIPRRRRSSLFQDVLRVCSRKADHAVVAGRSLGRRVAQRAA